MRISFLPALSLSLSLLLPLLSAGSAAASGALHTDGNTLRDAQNAVVILRGVDVAGNSKVPPFTPITDGALLDPLPKWGVNAMRLLFTWEAFEPQQGQDSASYLTYIRGVIEAAHARGIYVVVDFHQDAYSRYSLQGCGEGFPSWALPPGITPATPDNGADCSDWGIRLTGDATLAATWNGFYSDGGGVRSAYLAMLGRVAAALADEPGVIGYDLLNEPGGDEVTQLSPLYEDAAAAIRAADKNAILFVGPGVVTSVGSASKLPKPTFGNFVFAPHFYDVTIKLGTWNGSDESMPLAQLTSPARAWNVPVFLGEFGAPPSVDQVDDYLTAVDAQLDQGLWSSAQWAYTPGWTPAKKDGWNLEDFSIVDDKGLLRANFRARPFARRFAGTPDSVTAVEGKTPSASTFTVAWENDAGAGATEIFAPSDWFGGGVSVDGSGNVTCTVAGEIISCTSSTTGKKQVVVSAKRSCGLTGGEALLMLLLLRRRRKRL